MARLERDAKHQHLDVGNALDLRCIALRHAVGLLVDAVKGPPCAGHRAHQRDKQQKEGGNQLLAQREVRPCGVVLHTPIIPNALAPCPVNF